MSGPIVKRHLVKYKPNRLNPNDNPTSLESTLEAELSKEKKVLRYMLGQRDKVNSKDNKDNNNINPNPNPNPTYRELTSNLTPLPSTIQWEILLNLMNYKYCPHCCEGYIYTCKPVHTA